MFTRMNFGDIILFVSFFIIGFTVGAEVIHRGQYPVEYSICKDGYYSIMVRHGDGTRTMIKTEEECK